jgi:uncharacterized protein YdeI (BOF family)
MKNYIFAIVVIAVLILGFYYLSNKQAKDSADKIAEKTQDVGETSTTTPAKKDSTNDEVKVLGKSVEGRDIYAFSYGTGEDNLIFIGGIHGGYSWNTSLTAYELMAYLRSNPEVIPKNIKVTVVPVMNPDGLSKVVPNVNRFNGSQVNPSQEIQISGRFNANQVDLSRNFDCDWKEIAKWQTRDVSGGTSVFSEPESVAIKNFIESIKPKAVVVWYSSAGGVYSSSCGVEVSKETKDLTDLYAKATGYPGFTSFDYYETSGDLPNWLAKINIPAISVLLTDHVGTDWTKNKSGVEAMLSHYRIESN